MPVNMCRKMIRWREDGKGQERKSVSLLEKKGQLIGEGDLNVGEREGESKDTLVYIGCC